MEEKRDQQLVAIVTVTEPGETPEKPRYLTNGTIFWTTKERADYYRENGYARILTPEEQVAADRLPKPKHFTPPVKEPTVEKKDKDTDKGQVETKDAADKGVTQTKDSQAADSTDTAGEKKLGRGRHNRRDMRAQQ